MADETYTPTQEEIDETIRKLNLKNTINVLIGKNDDDWYKDFMAGVACGIAAQKILR
jgi:hypothetical protein